MGNRVKKMKPGKLTGPSHAKGGILLEAEGGEYIIKKSSVKKIGKKKLDKINREGKLPVSSERKRNRAKKKLEKLYKKDVKTYKRLGKIDTKQEKLLKKKAEKAERRKAKELNLPSAEDISPDYHLSDVVQVTKAGREQRKKTKEKNLRYKHLEKRKARNQKRLARTQKKRQKQVKKAYPEGEMGSYKKGGSVGSPIKSYSSGGYVEGK